jgi:hypothetical protein
MISSPTIADARDDADLPAKDFDWLKKNRRLGKPQSCRDRRPQPTVLAVRAID